MTESLIALAVGIVTGFIFTLFKLPVPAPGVLPGVVGIVGVYAGSKLFEYLSSFFS